MSDTSKNFSRYQKYKHKYTQLRADHSKRVVDTQPAYVYNDYWNKLNYLMAKIQSDTISLELVNMVYTFFLQYLYYDANGMHQLDDYLKKKFLEQIANHRISDLTTIREIATAITNMEHAKWTYY